MIEVKSINAGHKEDVTFPSEDDGVSAPADRKEKILIPAELFEKQGMK